MTTTEARDAAYEKFVLDNSPMTVDKATWEFVWDAALEHARTDTDGQTQKLRDAILAIPNGRIKISTLAGDGKVSDLYQFFCEAEALRSLVIKAALEDTK